MDGARRIDGGGVDVVHAFPPHPVHERGVGLQQPVSPAAINDDCDESLATVPALVRYAGIGRGDIRQPILLQDQDDFEIPMTGAGARARNTVRHPVNRQSELRYA